MVDYFAEYFKLPFLDPYLKKDGDFTHGANFAVAGATALDIPTLAKKNVSVSLTNSSLSVQLDWFRAHLKSICNSPSDCKDKLRNALILMGEIGGNDINDALFERQSIEDVRKFVPEVIQKIKSAVKEVIDVGAVRVVVPGNFPIGCVPVYLSGFRTNDSAEFDELKCLKKLNAFAGYQNDLLQQAVKELQQEHPHVAVVYIDYYDALRQILRSPTAMGFDKNATQKACCGGGDATYNFNWGRTCGNEGVPVCPNPEDHVSWDGIHLTSHAYQRLADILVKQIVSGISPVETSSAYRQSSQMLTLMLTFILSYFLFLLW